MSSNSDTAAFITDISIFKVGRVVEIIGQDVKVRVDKGKNSSSILYQGEVIQNIAVGSYIKIKKGFEILIGKIEGESIKESSNGSSYISNKDKVNRVLTIKLLGYLDDGIFKRGIKELPLVDNNCYLLRTEEFNRIHDFIEKGDAPIKIGHLENDESQEIKLGINKLFASHIGIFGNTGSGKSYTLAKLYRELFCGFIKNKKFTNNAKFYLIDFNGEYIGTLNDELTGYSSKDVIIPSAYKNVFELSTKPRNSDSDEDKKFPINLSTINDPVFWSIFLEATEKTQKPFINRALKDTYINDHISSDEGFRSLLQDKIYQAVTQIDKKTEKSIITDLLNELYSYLSDNDSIREAERHFREYGLMLKDGKAVFKYQNQYSDNENHLPFFKDNIDSTIANINNIGLNEISEIRRVGLKIIIKYYDEMIRGFVNREHLSPLIKRLEKRIDDLEKVLTIKKEPESNKNLTIISLRNVNLDIRKMLPLLISKELYESKKADSDKSKSLHLIIDEAHNILSHDSVRESEGWRDYRLETFEEIIKEGRKFNTFLTIASQRPSDISPTIISQLHNYFLHRLINNNDLKAVEKTIAYLDKVSADSIPNLPTGTCILAGLIAQIPVVMKVGAIEGKQYEPQSHNINLIQSWS